VDGRPAPTMTAVRRGISRRRRGDGTRPLVPRFLQPMDRLQLDLMHLGAAGSGDPVEGCNRRGFGAGELAAQRLAFAIAEVVARQIALKGTVDGGGIGAACGGEAGCRAGRQGLFLRRLAGRGAGGGRTHIGPGEGRAREAREKEDHQAQLARAGSRPGAFSSGLSEFAGIDSHRRGLV